MQTEELFCESCKKVWNRQKTRGRKPKICPDCVPQLVVQHDDNDEEDNDLLDIPVAEEPPPDPTKYPAPSKWYCPVCSVTLKTYVGLNQPPTHPCKKKLLKKTLPLELIGK